MNHLQHYLGKLAEEGSEVSQIALKTQQFGPGEVMPGQPLNNFERCHLELDDLNAMVEELNEKFGFSYTPNRERMEAKKAKVRKYLEFSMHLGMVEGKTDVCEHPMAKNAAAVEGNFHTNVVAGSTDIEALRGVSVEQVEAVLGNCNTKLFMKSA